MSGGLTLAAHPALRFLLSLLETNKLLVDGFCAFYTIAHFHFSVEIKETGDFFFYSTKAGVFAVQRRIKSCCDKTEGDSKVSDERGVKYRQNQKYVAQKKGTEQEEVNKVMWVNRIEVKKKPKSQLFHLPGCLNPAPEIGNSGVP